MKLLVLPRYGRLGASSRVRFLQYLPWLEAAGIDVTVLPLFSDAYVQGLQLQKRSIVEVVAAYFRRVQALVAGGSFDLVWIEKETLPWVPAWLERMLASRHIPYALDYDDAVFHYYDWHRSPLVRRILGGKHPALMRGAAAVVAGNQYLADFARDSGAKHVEIVPTVIDLERYPSPPPENILARESRPCVGWIGQRATASFLEPYKPLFERLLQEGLGYFAAIGIDTRALGLPMESIAWSEQTEVASIASFDIGIMPLVDEPFERGKCGYKLIQYMACGLPVVASPVGVNCQIVEHGVNGFLAETPEQWEHAMRVLLADPALRTQMGQAGRQKVEKQYCIQVTGPRLAGLLKAVARACA